MKQQKFILLPLFVVYLLTASLASGQGAKMTGDASSIHVARTEVHPIQTLTLTDQQFLTAAKDGKPTTVAGVLRIPRPGTERLPAVILLHGSSGVGGNVDYWQQHFNRMGVATFVIDYFTGRGIANTNADQSKLGRLTEIIDAYRALALLAANPRIDSNRIAVMGFSRGAHAALYSSLTRFQKMYAPEGVSFVAYLAFYAVCNIRYLDDEAVSDRPIRLFHGAADDYVSVAPCRAYVERLRKAGKDVQLTEYPDAHHVFDNPLLKETPVAYPTWQTQRHCTLQEVSPGRIINAETKQPFTYADPCIELGPHIAYNPAALDASTKAVTDFLRGVFSLK
jgi:dienelactone hydrolase